MANVYLSEAPPLLGFCLGCSSNFVGSESGQIQSVKLRAEYGPQQNPILGCAIFATFFIYMTAFCIALYKSCLSTG
jgi:hypothetical protein